MSFRPRYCRRCGLEITHPETSRHDCEKAKTERALGQMRFKLDKSALEAKPASTWRKSSVEPPPKTEQAIVALVDTQCYEDNPEGKPDIILRMLWWMESAGGYYLTVNHSETYGAEQVVHWMPIPELPEANDE